MGSFFNVRGIKCKWNVGSKSKKTLLGKILKYIYLKNLLKYIVCTMYGAASYGLERRLNILFSG